jgi:hypothetical protein
MRVHLEHRCEVQSHANHLLAGVRDAWVPETHGVSPGHYMTELSAGPWCAAVRNREHLTLVCGRLVTANTIENVDVTHYQSNFLAIGAAAEKKTNNDSYGWAMSFRKMALAAGMVIGSGGSFVNLILPIMAGIPDRVVWRTRRRNSNTVRTQVAYPFRCCCLGKG